ncbi:MAG: ArsR family transcriptional regulator [Deltaproteobacteria bacterium CG03_land_8_20_14_0_80_45_14]|nr:MAG: ArsR family transcriptional regulator [Deltaproteobacteria bacterium CG03_land_8_20_14_0_80_45_14]
MRVRDIRISIKTKEGLFNEVEEVWGKLEKGEKVKRHEGISFENIEAMRKILSEERLRILKAIKKEHPTSIYELAKFLKRDIKNTFDDVQFLARIGLIELEKTKEGREKTVPKVNYDRILLEIPV